MDCITTYIPDYIEDFTPTREDEREAQLGQMRDEASLARRKAVAIQRLLDGQPLSYLSMPDERTLIQWHVKTLFDEAQRTEKRISELETPPLTRKSRLRAEWKTLQKTWMLHAEGQDKITQRQSEIEAELTEIEEQTEVLNVA